MMILALDLGTTTGWAKRMPDGTIISGTMCWKSKRIESKGWVFIRFQQWLEKQLKDGDSTVYFEEVRRHIGTAAAHVYGGFLAVLIAYCDLNSIPYQSVPVGTIKLHATGKGNANKTAMITAMVAKGYAPKDDNEADALALIHWTMDQEGRL